MANIFVQELTPLYEKDGSPTQEIGGDGSSRQKIETKNFYDAYVYSLKKISIDPEKGKKMVRTLKVDGDNPKGIWKSKNPDIITVSYSTMEDFVMITCKQKKGTAIITKGPLTFTFTVED